MNRRHFLALPALALTTSTLLADSGSRVEFSLQVYQEALQSGEPFLLDFSASW